MTRTGPVIFCTGSEFLALTLGGGLAATGEYISILDRLRPAFTNGFSDYRLTVLTIPQPLPRQTEFAAVSQT